MSVDLRRVGVTFSFLIGIVCSSAYSQTVTRFDVIEASRSVNCEYVAAMVDSFVQGVPKEKLIIVLAYTGKNETKRDIGKRRLHNAKTYLVEYYKDTKFSRPSANVITALADSSSNEGKVDFYVDGELKLSIHLRSDRDLDLSPCYLESSDYCKDKIKKQFYPCLDRRESSRP